MIFRLFLFLFVVVVVHNCKKPESAQGPPHSHKPVGGGNSHSEGQDANQKF